MFDVAVTSPRPSVFRSVTLISGADRRGAVAHEQVGAALKRSQLAHVGVTDCPSSRRERPLHVEHREVERDRVGLLAAAADVHVAAAAAGCRPASASSADQASATAPARMRSRLFVTSYPLRTPNPRA